MTISPSGTWQWTISDYITRRRAEIASKRPVLQEDFEHDEKGQFARKGEGVAKRAEAILAAAHHPHFEGVNTPHLTEHARGSAILSIQKARTEDLRAHLLGRDGEHHLANIGHTALRFRVAGMRGHTVELPPGEGKTRGIIEDQSTLLERQELFPGQHMSTLMAHELLRREGEPAHLAAVPTPHLTPEARHSMIVDLMAGDIHNADHRLHRHLSLSYTLGASKTITPAAVKGYVEWAHLAQAHYDHLAQDIEPHISYRAAEHYERRNGIMMPGELVGTPGRLVPENAMMNPHETAIWHDHLDHITRSDAVHEFQSLNEHRQRLGGRARGTHFPGLDDHVDHPVIVRDYHRDSLKESDLFNFLHETEPDPTIAALDRSRAWHYYHNNGTFTEGLNEEMSTSSRLRTVATRGHGIGSNSLPYDDTYNDIGMLHLPGIIPTHAHAGRVPSIVSLLTKGPGSAHEGAIQRDVSRAVGVEPEGWTSKVSEVKHYPDFRSIVQVYAHQQRARTRLVLFGGTGRAEDGAIPTSTMEADDAASPLRLHLGLFVPRGARVPIEFDGVDPDVAEYIAHPALIRMTSDYGAAMRAARNEYATFGPSWVGRGFVLTVQVPRAHVFSIGGVTGPGAIWAPHERGSSADGTTTGHHLILPDRLNEVLVHGGDLPTFVQEVPTRDANDPPAGPYLGRTYFPHHGWYFYDPKDEQARAASRR